MRTAFNTSAKIQAVKIVRACGIVLLLCAFDANAQTTINVSTAAQLQSAVQTANGAGGNRVISVADGTYTLVGQAGLRVQ